MHNADRIKYEGNRPLERYRHKWEDNIEGVLRARLPVL